MARTSMARTKTLAVVLAALCVVGMSGCKSSSDTGPASASEKKAFAGVNDPAQKAKDMARMSAGHNGAPGGPPAGAGH